MRDRFRREYRQALGRFLVDGDEAGLGSAYELGRRAVQAGLGLLDLVTVHHECAAEALEEAGGWDERKARAAFIFSMESLSAFEMVQRGFREVQEIAVVEKRYAEQLRRLADVSLAVASTLSAREIGSMIAESASGVFGEACCYVEIWEEGDGQAPPIASSALCEDCARFVASDDFERLRLRLAGVEDVLEVSRPDLVAGVDWEGPAALLAPLLGRGERQLGLACLLHRSDAPVTDNDRSILIQLTQTIAAAIENIRLYERERDTAETLQRALLPQELPSVAGVELAARYLPGAAGLNVGGDWYDVVTLGSGRIGVAMGDIVGRGVRAASSMGQVRMAFRAFAMEDTGPDVVVRRTDRLVRALEPDHFSTLVYVVADLAGDRLSFSRAGHPPPLVLPPEGPPRFLEDPPSGPLGVGREPVFRQGGGSFEPGSTLLLYTDGLLGWNLDDSMGALAEVAARRHGDLEDLCDQVLERLLPGGSHDDAALLALRRG